MTTPKEKDMPVALSHVAESVSCLSHSRAQLKRVVVAAFRLCRSLEHLQNMVIPRHSGQLFNQNRLNDRKKAIPGTAGSCSTQGRPTGENGKKANCSTLLKRITRLKCVNSKVKSNVECYSLDRDSPKGSCHLVEPT